MNLLTWYIQTIQTSSLIAWSSMEQSILNFLVEGKNKKRFYGNVKLSTELAPGIWFMWEHNTEKWHWLSDLYKSREWYFKVRHSLLFFVKVNPQTKFILRLLPFRFFPCDIWVLKFHFLKKDIPTSAKVKVLRFQSMKALNFTLLKSCHPNFSVSCVDFLRHKMWSDISYCGYTIYYII